MFLRSSGMTRHHCRARLCARLQVYSITSNATESALASADGYASEPVSLGAVKSPKTVCPKISAFLGGGFPDYLAVQRFKG